MYKTLAELKKAYESGELSKEKHILTIDNDSTTIYSDENHPQADKWGKIFNGGNPEDLLEEALDLLGIPHQGA